METEVTTTESAGTTESASTAATGAESSGQASYTESASTSAQTQSAGTQAQSAGAQSTQQTYSPQYKFKVKEKELDFDEYIRPVITSKEVEDKVRDLYEKAYGIEEVKADRQSLKDKVKEWESKVATVESSLKTLGSYAQKKDYRTFFDILQIPRQDVINYALEELRYEELPAEQKAIIEAQRQREREYEAQVNQSSMLQQQMQQLVTQQTTWELNQALSAPDISQAVQAFDARVGQPGALQAEVIRRGQYYEAVHKKSPSARQLVEEILSIAGISAATQAGNMQTQSQGFAGTPPSTSQQKPTIPSFQGGNAGKSPVKKVPTSIEDLRKMRQHQHNL